MGAAIVSETNAPPLIEYFTSKLPEGASSRFRILADITVAVVSEVEVNFLPDAGAIMASTFRSLSEIVPLHVPVFGCVVIASARLPGFPLILARTVTLYVESFESPLNV